MINYTEWDFVATFGLIGKVTLGTNKQSMSQFTGPSPAS